MVSARDGAAASSDQLLSERTSRERQAQPLAQRLSLLPPGTVATHQAFTARVADLAARYHRSYARYQALDTSARVLLTATAARLNHPSTPLVRVHRDPRAERSDGAPAA